MIREGKAKSTEVTIAELPEYSTMLAKKHSKIFTGNQAPFNLGFSLSDANPAVRHQFDLEEDVKKPVVLEITPQSPAAIAGMLPGDVVLDVNRQEVSTAQEAFKALRKGSNTMRLSRQQAVVFVVLEAK